MIRCAILCLSLAACGGALAQSAAPAPSTAQALQRIELQKQMFPPDKYVTYVYKVVVPVGGAVPRHTHHGIEMGYVIEGEASMTIEGQPAITLKPGDSFSVPPGVIHGATNTGAVPNVIVASFVVERDKPLATPAP